MKLDDYVLMIESAVKTFRGVIHPCTFVSIPRGFKSFAFARAKKLGIIEIAAYNHTGQPFYRVGEKYLMRMAEDTKTSEGK